MALAKSSDLNEAWIVLRERFTSTDLVLTLGHQGLWCARAETKDVIMLDAHSVSAVDETLLVTFIGYLAAAMPRQPLPVALAQPAPQERSPSLDPSFHVYTYARSGRDTGGKQLNWRTLLK